MDKPKTFVIIHSNFIGDNLLTNSLVQNIKRLYKNSKVVSIVQPEMVEISKYQEYPILQKKLQLLQNQWKSAVQVLGNLGVIDTKISLLDILTDQMTRRDWYHYNRLIDILEKCKMLDEYQEVASRYAAVKNEISILESPEYESSKYKKEIALKRKSEVTNDMNTCNNEIHQLKDELTQLEALYHIIQNKDENLKRLDLIKGDIQRSEESLDTLSRSIKKIEFNNDQISDLHNKLDKYTLSSSFS